MPIRHHLPHASPLASKSCTDPIVGAILSGWRYDISAISPEMRTDYETHLLECTNCRRRQRKARTFDLLLISVSTLSILAFLLAALVMKWVEATTHIAGAVQLPLHVHDMPVMISLEAAAIAGVVISTILWVLVAIATPLPVVVTTMVRQRLARRHA